MWALPSASGCNLIGYEARGRASADGGAADSAVELDAAFDGGSLEAAVARPDAAGARADDAGNHGLDSDAEAGTWTSDAAVVCTDPMRCNYACPAGASECDLTCLGSRECTSKCTAGALCRTTCQGAEHCHIECPPFSSCEVTCRGSAECQPHCRDNSICHVTCIDNECAGVSCDPKADCTLTCLGSSVCAFKRCDTPQCVGEQTMYCGGSHTCTAP